jgi:hypothetical protein
MDWLERLNTAPFRYRSVVNATRGPIQRLSIRTIECTDAVQKQHEAHAYLLVELRSAHPPTLVIYGHVDGTGTSVWKRHAIYKAISEAFERWAFYQVSRSSEYERFGFHIDPSTSGMAAHPGPGRCLARGAALLEAKERWSLQAWWSGILPVVEQSQDAFEIKTPWPNTYVALLRKSCQWLEENRFVYGFAAGATWERALIRARVELGRNENVILNWVRKGSNRPQPIDLFEKRLVFFSSEEGSMLFSRALRTSISITSCSEKPELLVDSQLVGSWTDHATVWRCVFKPTHNGEAFADRADYFLF